MTERKDVKLAYVGSVVPDEEMYTNAAFSRAGNMCQLSLLEGLRDVDLSPSLILSVRPVPSYLRSRVLVCKAKSVTLNKEIKVKLLPFLNITLFKQVSLGLFAMMYLFRWGLKNRGSKKIIYSFNISVPPSIFILIAARITGSKVVAMVYDINVPGETIPRSLLWRIDYWQHRKFLRKYDGLVVITKEIASDFAPNVPFLLLEGGVNHRAFEEGLNVLPTEKLQSDIFTIVVAGSLSQANGIQEVLTAFSLLKGEKYKLLIAGRGGEVHLVLKAAVLDQRIEYLGFLNHKQVIALYSTADVLVNMRLTKLIDTRYVFPSKILEYLASGVPVISTCPGNMADEYKDVAYLLYDETPLELAEMMMSVACLSESVRYDMGMKAMKFMMERKTWKVQSERIKQFLYSLD